MTEDRNQLSLLAFVSTVKIALDGLDMYWTCSRSNDTAAGCLNFFFFEKKNIFNFCN
jgi:hypothetical protein